jgi:hypothetical protein
MTKLGRYDVVVRNGRKFLDALLVSTMAARLRCILLLVPAILNSTATVSPPSVDAENRVNRRASSSLNVSSKPDGYTD